MVDTVSLRGGLLSALGPLIACGMLLGGAAEAQLVRPFELRFEELAKTVPILGALADPFGKLYGYASEREGIPLFAGLLGAGALAPASDASLNPVLAGRHQILHATPILHAAAILQPARGTGNSAGLLRPAAQQLGTLPRRFGKAA
jgi:hypothetical protein